MRTRIMTITALVLAFGLMAEAAAAQQPAPAVPRTPDPPKIDRELIIEQGVKPPGQERRTARDRNAETRPQPERDPPMPKPVPSIIRP